MKVHTCFSPKYYADTPTASMRKLPIVANLVEKAGLVYLEDPTDRIEDAKRYISQIHDADYVKQFTEGTGLCSSQGWPWTEAIRDGVFAIHSGQIKAADLAIQYGIAANIAQGFHHSVYKRGMGLCTFNGLATVARFLEERRSYYTKVGVLDCDDHFGNGTAEFTYRLPNLYNYTIYGAETGKNSEYYVVPHERSIHNCVGRGKGYENYRKAVEAGIQQLQQWNVDFIIYQAGADVHHDDPYGSVGLTTEEMRLRDRLVFTLLKKMGKPVLFVLAGGYQEPIKEKLAHLHVATFEEAVQAYKDK